ncbi:hydrogen peroxide-inducible genes activator [Pseudohaliea sp.]|uniref:hydrogen peroxide-inducible genes activator n=1 Tax=Pseudohaliea sp. TaxID=2740289 RepID=UPI0032ED95F4
MSERPTLRQLEYFMAVARCGSLRRAADELAISQPTLTAQIARAEATLGVTLFERTRSGARLTPAGRRLEPHARRVLEAVEELASAADASRGGAAGTYRLGVKSTLGPYLLPRILPRLHERYTDLKLYVREDSVRRLEEGLERGEYDMIVTALPINSREIRAETLLREDIRLVMPVDHPLARKPRLTGADLAGQQILTTEQGHLFSQLVEQACARLGAELLRDYQGTSLDALRVMVVMGMGLAFLPALYIASEIDDDTGLAVRDIEGEGIARILVLAWRGGSPARAFYRRLAADIRELTQEEVGDVVQVLSGD